MPQKRILILPAQLVEKIDQNRGDLSQAEFLELLIDSRLEQERDEKRFVSKETLSEFDKDIKELLRSFLEFFINYSLEMGQRPKEEEVEALGKKLQELGTTPRPSGKPFPRQ